MNWSNYIVADPTICHGQPHIRGTRIMVSVIIDNLATGMTTDEIIQSYPSLSRDAIQAVVNYAEDNKMRGR